MQHGVDPFGHSDPFGSPPPSAGHLRAPAPSAPARPLPPPPSPYSLPGADEMTVQLARPGGSRASRRPTIPNPLAGWLFSGVGTAMVTSAAAVVLALPELEMFYGDVRTIALTAAVALVALAAVVCWLAFRCVRGRAHTRVPTTIGCAVAVAAAPAVWLLTPTFQVAWLATMTRVTAIVAAVVAVAAVAMLFAPQRSARSAPPARRAAHTTPARVPQPVAVGAVVPPAQPSWQPSQPTLRAGDYDPFS
ncbi:hypothetical protein [Mycobacterium sp. ACS4331]|uniref:hypothetical protein n=1 Tax=Mycobacterium sp. ACS4331 TaxID=1834121 RepID=UPI000801EF14|nr:hypothetical protein [Mycobacterium sp. ACS4331]OBF19746.1 hypothetical protein A5727_09820 [Mycobacterium sp. ACS4331]